MEIQVKLNKDFKEVGHSRYISNETLKYMLQKYFSKDNVHDKITGFTFSKEGVKVHMKG